MAARKGPKYSSPLRTSQAQANRASILSAAHDLFVAQGFGGTTIDQIASAAGVSKPTIFSAIGNKAAVFKAVRDIAMAGDDSPKSVSQRSSADRIRSASDLPSAVQALTLHIVGVVRRAAGIEEVLRGAAANGDREMQKLWEDSEQERRVGAELLLTVLVRKSPLAIPRERAIDILGVLMAPDNYQRLVIQCGWSDLAFRKWLGEAVITQLFAGGAE